MVEQNHKRKGRKRKMSDEIFLNFNVSVGGSEKTGGKP